MNSIKIFDFNAELPEYIYVFSYVYRKDSGEYVGSTELTFDGEYFSKPENWKTLMLTRHGYYSETLLPKIKKLMIVDNNKK